jgi:hypothetical protein
MIVQWPSRVDKQANIWRVLDLSGMTKSVRDSRNFMKAGFVWINGNSVLSLKDMVEVGTTFTLELRFPSGKIVSRDIYLSSRDFRSGGFRGTGPRVLNYRG